MEQIPAVQTGLLRQEKYDRDEPVWAVPRWFGEKPQLEPPGPEHIREAEERAAEMKLYAMRMPFLSEPPNLN